MKSISFPFAGPRTTSATIAVLMFLALLPYGSADAQAPPPPAAFQDLYSSLNTYLVNFNGTLNAGTLPQSSTVFAGNLEDANANAGPQLVNPGAMAGIELQLQELQAMGVKAVMVQVCFPILYEPFLTSQGQSYAQFVSFYQQVAASVRAAGLKLIVENDTLLTSNDVQSGWNVAPFYATLDWADYQQARAQNAAVVAQTMQPDYLVVLEEPDTEAANSGQSNVNTASGATAMLSQILASVQQAGVPKTKLGAGVGTWLNGYLGFIQGFVALPVDFIDMHIYPVNDSFLPNALQIASTAAAAGKPLGMSECWLSKERDSEVGVLANNVIRARDPFSFWAPEDAYFLQTMESLARYTQMAFLAPMGSQYFSAYLPYGTSTENLPPGQILSQESAQASQNVPQAIFTSTATSYYASLVAPRDTVPPSVPTGVAGASGNPNTATLSWSASTDNVGVAGYNVLRNGSIVGVTAQQYYQDSGLTESATYTYTIESFDLGGNVSAPSQRVNVTTRDVTPPSVPAGVAATAVSCQRATLTWLPSTDNSGVGSYIVFWGLSPGALVQVARTAGTSTSYNSSPLTAGTTYYYGVEAADTSGNVSAMSAIVSATTPTPPSAPANLTAAAASDSRIGLTWSASASGGLPVQYYHVYRGSSAYNLSQIAVVAAASYSDATVNQTTTYYYAVQAADTAADLSPMSAIVRIATPAPPGTPTNLAATPSSSSLIGLAWSASASGGLPVQYYHVYRGATASNMSQVGVVQQTSYWDSTVTAGGKYYYAVQAADTAGDLSAMSAAVLATAPTGPSVPCGLAATAVSTTKISLSWSPSASGGLPIQNYRVFRGVTALGLSQIATVVQPAYTDTSGSPATKYFYAVEAVDTGGDLSAMSVAVSATTLALPSAPRNLAASATKYQVSLTWTAAQSGMPLASYTVFRGSSPSNLISFRVVAPTATSMNDSSVVVNTTYYYGIQAQDTGGNISPMSAIVAVTIP